MLIFYVRHRIFQHSAEVICIHASRRGPVTVRKCQTATAKVKCQDRTLVSRKIKLKKKVDIVFEPHEV